MRARQWLLAIVLAPGTAAGFAATIEGRVELFSDGRALRPEEANEVLVYFRPQVPVATTPLAEPVVMSTRRKRFQPRTLAVTVGSRVRFPNQDPILHNVFSTAQGNAFDTGLLAEGEGGEITFRQAGYVRIYCNVHHAMVGHLLVLDTPFFTRPDGRGRFRLDGLPDGPGELVFWHDRARPWRQTVQPELTQAALEIRLELAQRRVPPHMNKFGRPYDREPRGGYQ
jgi:plastocyanin